MNCELSNMKTIKVMCLLCVALLSPIIEGSTSNDTRTMNPLNQTQTKVDDIMKRGGTINNIFKPLEFIGSGYFSVSYQGELGQSRKIVAMKISPISLMLKDPIDEYLMYTYIGAIDNVTVENYGVPAVYYYNANWEGCTLLALTLVESQFTELIHNRTIQFEDLDILIILREFVRISKYIHSCGVCHADLCLNNMMFRKNQGFLIDFNWSMKVNVGVKPNLDCRKADWRRFLMELCFVSGFPIDSDDIVLDSIENMKDNDGLRLVLMNFAKHAFKSAEPVNYNQMHKIITDEIHIRGVQEPALVSWLTDAQKNETRDEWPTTQIPAIKDIAEPQTQCIYPKPIFDYFDNFSSIY